MQRIVVGIDGSPGAGRALERAVGEAKLRAAPTGSALHHPLTNRLVLWADEVPKLVTRRR